MTASPSPSESTPASAPDRAGARASFARAQGYAQAVASVLDDAAVPSWVAAELVDAGWRALVDAAGSAPAEPSAADDTHAVADRIEAGELPWLAATRREGDGGVEQVAADLRKVAAGAQRARHADQPVDPSLLVPLRRSAAALHATVAVARDTRFDPGAATASRRRLLRRVGLAAVVLLPIAVLLVLTSPGHREGPWRGQYFDNTEFSGEPLQRRDGDIKFDWQRKSPSPSLPDDGFSVRWDSCMELPEALDIAFALISDDGSRLYIDGELVVDNWGRHGERSRGDTVPVAAGVHHIRVEYFDERHAASVELRASLRGELPASLPVRILRYPGDDFDPDDPCAAVRAP